MAPLVCVAGHFGLELGMPIPPGGPDGEWELPLRYCERTRVLSAWHAQGGCGPDGSVFNLFMTDCVAGLTREVATQFSSLVSSMLGYLQEPAHDGPGDGGRVLFVPVPSTKRLPRLLARACAEAVVGGEVLDVLRDENKTLHSHKDAARVRRERAAVACDRGLLHAAKVRDVDVVVLVDDCVESGLAMDLACAAMYNGGLAVDHPGLLGVVPFKKTFRTNDDERGSTTSELDAETREWRLAASLVDARRPRAARAPSEARSPWENVRDSCDPPIRGLPTSKKFAFPFEFPA